ncbi:hypothetical protein FZX01_16395 [Listeria monocytogenes]|uniref:hypothetical protein n=1 Tax=Listeria monocytogenes TaxID=1639 RepID=UPI0011EB357C|nr:hypothetical protein [Listeria monocytogenes]EHY7660665.1 hypothetical protein [Listeria monocytogenes]EHY7829592.1 hypothetical protein [Listeria monocytogenes]TYU82100.1 hypothetical protein FZX01_16395 [Listeria monocytogenes]
MKQQANRISPEARERLLEERKLLFNSLLNLAKRNDTQNRMHEIAEELDKIDGLLRRGGGK